MKFLVTFEVDVDFDTDGDDVVEFNIPAIKDAIEAEFEGTIHNAIDESLVEEISDASGWVVKSLNISEIKVIEGF
jgi:hypothetical protein